MQEANLAILAAQIQYQQKFWPHGSAMIWLSCVSPSNNENVKNN